MNTRAQEQEEQNHILVMKGIQLARIHEELKANYTNLKNEHKNLTLKHELLQEQYDLLKQKFWGRSSEKAGPEKQPELFDEAEVESVSEQEPEMQTVIQHRQKKRGGGSKKIPDWIPRKDILIDIPESEKKCACGCVMDKIGEDITERLHIKDPELWVSREIRPKYACNHCHGETTESAEDETTDPMQSATSASQDETTDPTQSATPTSQDETTDPMQSATPSGEAAASVPPSETTVSTQNKKPKVKEAPATPSIIPGGMASADLLSYILMAKYADMVPFYRQESQFRRLGIDISRQDMANWQIKVGDALEPLIMLMKEQIKSGNVLRMDETRVQVMGEEGRKDTQNSYMWLARGGPPGKQVVIYQYHPTRESVHINEFLTGFHGYLQTDGYDAYDCALKLHPKITHVGCFAHARRKFVEAQKSCKDKRSPEVALKYIRELYAIEARLREKLKTKAITGEQFVVMRKEAALPVLSQFNKWILGKLDSVTPGTLMGKAVFYAGNQWSKLAAYLGDAELTPDNNLSENAIRPFAIGRKNWMFYKSPAGAKSGCAIYSLIESAKINGINPKTYLTDVLEKVPYVKNDWDALLPWNAMSQNARDVTG